MVSSSVICKETNRMVRIYDSGYIITKHALKDLMRFNTHLFLNHAELLIYRLEMKAEEPRPVEKVFEVS